MLGLRTHIVICAALFAALLIIGWGGNILQATGVIAGPGRLRIPLLVLMLTLTAAFAFSLVPVMVKLVLGNDPGRGTTIVVYAIWGLMAAGLAVALPVAIANGFLTPAP
jgi:hypothetical protein